MVSNQEHGDNAQSGFQVDFGVKKHPQVYRIKHLHVFTTEELNSILLSIIHTNQTLNELQGPFQRPLRERN